MTARGRVPFYFDATFGAIDVRDVAAAHLNAVDRGRVGERYILSNHNMTLKDGLTLIAQASGRRPPSIHIGPGLLNALIALGKYLPGGMLGHLRTMRFWQPLNNGKAVAELGLPARPLADTARCLAWFKTNGYL
jgi:dihydroflavonol-4-reductase